MDEYVYDAFISYSHRDMQWGRWLQRKLEAFPVPRMENGQKREKLHIFRDQTDLAGAELQTALNRELKRSRYLIVICSPHSAASRWVHEEVRAFCEDGRRHDIIPFIVSGEPNSDAPSMECFPPLLRRSQEDELLGTNIQEIGKQKALLKVVSILLDIRLNRLVDREKQRRRRLGLSLGTAAMAACAVTGALLWHNAVITQKNRELSFDIYGAAIVSFARKDAIEPEEVEFLGASAEAGNVDAMLLLADCYEKGWGTDPDPEKAFFWFQKAAEKGSTQGMIAVANCYLQGIGVSAQAEPVFAWNMKAAEAGDVSGMVNAASCYEDGWGVKQDPAQAAVWYERAARAGSDLGMYHMARCYRSGIGVRQDPAQAFFWMHQLAQTGNADGMYNVALMYQYAYGTPEDPRQAFLWYQKAADCGYPDAMRMVGWCIENHYGVENMALEWYQRAVEAGNVQAEEDAARLQKTDE